MSDEEILKKALDKAVKNGFGMSKTQKTLFLEHDMDYYKIIFSHSFAKAFWGVKGDWLAKTYQVEAWQIHLQQMVLEENPLKYLERFLK